MKRNMTFLILLAAVTVTSLNAQTSQVLYYMNLPQSNTLNPAFQPSGRTYVGLPVISDISFRLDNNFLSFSELFSGGVISDSTFTFLQPGPDLDKFIAGLGDKNSLEPQVGLQLFGLAFTIGEDLRITFDITDRFDANIVFPGDFLRLGIEGNESFIGRNIDLSSLRTDFKYYHEIGFGASKNITEKLRIGARLKLLSGVAAAYLKNNGLTLTVNEDFTHTLNADLAFNLSAPYKFTTEDGIVHGLERDDEVFDSGNNVMSYLLGFKNPGLGIDVGAEYRINDMFAFSAAINDFGFIKWKRDRSELSVNAAIEMNGLTLQDVFDESVSFGELLNWAGDSLQNAFEVMDEPAAFTTWLPFSVTAGASFTPVSFFTAGVLSQTRFEGKQVHEAFTLSGNINFGNTFSTTLAYTLANRRYDNLGFGMAVRGGFFQFFALVDNIPMRYTRVTSGEDDFRVPENLYTVHARFGINLVFGNKAEEKILPPM